MFNGRRGQLTELVMKSVTKLLVLGMTALVSVVATTVPAFAEPMPGDNLSGDVAAATAYSGGVDVSADEGVSIRPGEEFEQENGASLELVDHGRLQEQRMTWDGSKGMDMSVIYRVGVDDGRDGGLWLKTRVEARGLPGDLRAAFATCSVFDGYPPHSGDANKPRESSLVTCSVNHDWFSNDFEVTVSLVKLAEASGTITPTNVDLIDGTFRTDVTYSRPAARDVAAGEHTRFDGVLMEGDRPFYENQARTEWSYQIVDGERETGFWVAGLSTNHRGATKFSPDGRCAIYDDNPLHGGGKLDYMPPVEGTPYICQATGRFVYGPGEDAGVVPGPVANVHFDATFTVTKK